MMQWPEFCELLQCLTYWYQTFNQYDMDRSGYIEAQELGRVIREKYGTVSQLVMALSSKSFLFEQELKFGDFYNQSSKLCQINLPTKKDHTWLGILAKYLLEIFKTSFLCLFYIIVLKSMQFVEKIGPSLKTEIRGVACFNISGYALSAKALETILKRYSRAMDDGRILIAFDDFVSMSVRLRAYTGKYKHFYFHYLISSLFCLVR